MPLKNKLKLSIVIPAYNEERHLPACLEAIAKQTVAPDEVIVVDSGSTDDTAKVCARFTFVRVVREPKRGIVYARNAGFNAATGNIIGRIDADVILPPDWVQYVKKFYQKPIAADAALTGGGYPTNLRLPKVCAWLQGHIAFRINKLLLGHYILFGSNMAITKKTWLEVKNKVCQRGDIHEDLDLAIHAYQAGTRIVYDTNLMVSGKARRVISERDKLFANLMMWPRTLKVHGKKTWFFGFVGAVALFILSPIPLFLEYGSRAIGLPALRE